MRDEAAALESHAERAEAALLPELPRLGERQRLGLGVPALGEIPDALLAAPPDDGDLAARAEAVEHQAHLPLAPPAVAFAPVGRRVLDLARQQRAALAELLQDVAAVGRVLLEPGDDPPVEWPVAAAHERLEDGQVLDREDERVPLHELSLLPQEAFELGGLEGPEAAPQDEMLGRSDARDRVELEEAKPADGLEDAVRALVQYLRAHGHPPRDLDRYLTHS